jgi:hypothetical protein
MWSLLRTIIPSKSTHTNPVWFTDYAGVDVLTNISPTAITSHGARAWFQLASTFGVQRIANGNLPADSFVPRAFDLDAAR